MNEVVATPKPVEPSRSSVIKTKVYAESRTPITVNKEWVPLDIRYVPMPKDARNFRCVMCGMTYPKQAGNFPSSGPSVLWRGNGGYLPFCKECCNTLLDNLIQFYSGNTEHAIKHMCRTFDWYYSEDVSAATINQTRETVSRIAMYPARLCMKRAVSRELTSLDNIREQYKETQRVMTMESVQATPTVVDDSVMGALPKDEFQVTKDIVRRWSTGMTAAEYEFLETELEHVKFNDVELSA